jgi:hypothetical protein
MELGASKSPGVPLGIAPAGKPLDGGGAGGRLAAGGMVRHGRDWCGRRGRSGGLLGRSQSLFQFGKALHRFRFEGLAILVESSLFFAFVLVLGKLAPGRADPLIDRIDLGAG